MVNTSSNVRGEPIVGTVSHLMMGVVYFFVVTPIGLCRVSSGATPCTAGPTATRAATGWSALVAAARGAICASSERAAPTQSAATSEGSLEFPRFGGRRAARGGPGSQPFECVPVDDAGADQRQRKRGHQDPADDQRFRGDICGRERGGRVNHEPGQRGPEQAAVS